MRLQLLIELKSSSAAFLPQGDDDRVWVIRVFWDPGDSDDKRSASDGVIWGHSGPRGWTLQVGGCNASDVAQEWGLPNAPGIYVDVIRLGPSVHRGVIDYTNEHQLLTEIAA